MFTKTSRTPRGKVHHSNHLHSLPWVLHLKEIVHEWQPITKRSELEAFSPRVNLAGLGDLLHWLPENNKLLLVHSEYPGAPITN